MLVIALTIMIVANVISTCNGSPSPNSLCDPGVVEEMPPHIRKVCLALKNSNNLSSALNAFIENEAQCKYSTYIFNKHQLYIN